MEEVIVNATLKAELEKINQSLSKINQVLSKVR